MRKVMIVAALAAFTASAEAQQGRPPAPQAKPPTQAAQPSPPLFACRTAEEICFLAVVTGKSQIAVLFTNADKAEGIDDKPIEALSGDAASATSLDLAPHLGRVVMLTGVYDQKAGLTKAELVEVASPLVSLIVKAQLGVEEEPPAAPGKPQPTPKPQASPKR